MPPRSPCAATNGVPAYRVGVAPTSHGDRKSSAHRLCVRAGLLVALLGAAACGRTPAGAAHSAPPPAGTTTASGPTGRAGQPPGDSPPIDARLLRWSGVVAPAAQWPGSGTDVLVLAGAPGMAPDAIDDALHATTASLRGLPGVTAVFSRARAGEARVVVRFSGVAGRGPDAARAVQAAWAETPPPGLAEPTTEPIARGARSIAGLETHALGGRPESTRYADVHLDAPLRAVPPATRVHLAGAVRPLLTLRVLPAVLAANGVTVDDVLQETAAWMQRQPVTHPPPEIQTFQRLAHDIGMTRRWTANNEKLPTVPVDRVADVTVEQGEPLREARNGPQPTTFWLLDGDPDSDVRVFERGIAKVAADSKDVFKPAVQSFVRAYRYVLVPAAGQVPERPDALAQRLRRVRETRPDIVALNAISGLDGVPEAVDADSVRGQRWTVFASIAAIDEMPEAFALRETLAEGGWDVRLLGRTDTALAWLCDAWGSAGVLLTATDADALATIAADVARQAASDNAKLRMLHGPQPGLAPPAWRKIDEHALARAQLPPAVAQHFVELVAGMQPVGWWHDTPVWLSLPVGELAHAVGQSPLYWGNGGGSGPGQAWLASDFLRIPDEKPSPELLRVDGKPAVWLAADAITQAPSAAAAHLHAAIAQAMTTRNTGALAAIPLDLAEPATPAAAGTAPSPQGTGR